MAKEPTGIARETAEMGVVVKTLFERMAEAQLIPSAAEIAAHLEAASGPSDALDELINYFVRSPPPHNPDEKGPPPGFGEEPFLRLGYWGTPYTRYIDVALTLLDATNDWRRLTPKSMSVYAASPYNAKAQVRYDGYGATPALQLCAAFFKMRAAIEAKAAAAEAKKKEPETPKGITHD